MAGISYSPSLKRASLELLRAHSPSPANGRFAPAQPCMSYMAAIVARLAN